nr:Transcriptional regulator, HxlR family [Amycolatopsis sp.]
MWRDTVVTSSPAADSIRTSGSPTCDGLVVRTYHAEVPPRVEYEVSELGRSLGPLFASLSERSADLEKVEAARHAYDERGAVTSR